MPSSTGVRRSPHLSAQAARRPRVPWRVGACGRAGADEQHPRRVVVMADHKVGTREEWQAAREELLRREKEHTRMGDDLARQRRELPWVPVDKEYRFDTDDGPRSLAELF